MATGGIVVNVMDVGQGQGTFVEVYNTGSVLTNTLLFDLGSAKSSRAAGDPSIAYIVSKVSSMAVPKIDYLSLSHKDRDHVNLVMRLIDAISEKIKPKKLKIGKVRFGGAKGWYKDPLMEKLEEFCKDVDSLSLRQTGFTPPKTWKSIWDENDVYVYVVLANVPTDVIAMDMDDMDDRPDSELANSVSIVSLVYWNGNEFFINGDATFVTIQESNKVLKAAVFNTKMVTLPHHGSRRTTFGLSESLEDASKESTEIVKTFAKKVNAKTVTASAEDFGNYKHPSYDVITLFNEYADQKKIWYFDPNLADNDRHYLTAYLDTPMTRSKKVTISPAYSSFETTMNVYSTQYCSPKHRGDYLAPPTNPVDAGTAFKKPPPIFSVGIQWVYTATSAGVTLTAKENRAATAFNIEEVARELGPPVKWVKKISPDDNGTPVKTAVPAKSAVLRSLKTFR
jgi:beta-lactamase superfamily II metal-dependent hydrolase